MGRAETEQAEARRLLDKAEDLEAELALEEVWRGVMKKGYKVPTPIQRKTVPLVMDGTDVVATMDYAHFSPSCTSFSPRDGKDVALYDLRNDPHEDRNLADDPISNNTMSIGEWLDVCEHMGLFESSQLSLFGAKMIFKWSRIRSATSFSTVYTSLACQGRRPREGEQSVTSVSSRLRTYR